MCGIFSVVPSKWRRCYRMNLAQKYLQPYYNNGVFGNIHPSAGQHYKINIDGTPIAVMGVVDKFGLRLSLF